MTFQVFDTTLRDGAQREGISYSVVDKLAVARLLDEFGVGFIEGGWPGAMPKDTEFFRRARTELDLKHALLVAFGATRKAGVDVPTTTRRCARCSTPRPRRSAWSPSPTSGTSSGRCAPPARRTWRWSATPWRYFVAEGRRVFLDCEHFFDGFRFDPDVHRARRRRPRSRPAPRSWSCATPTAACCRRRITARDRRALAERARRRRAGRGSASTARTTPPARWPTPSPRSRPACGTSSAPPTATASGPATPTSSPSSRTSSSSSGCPSYRTAAWNRWCGSPHAIAEIANIAPDTHQAYVGAAAFAHKAGLHASAIKVDPVLYNHVDPAVVGNDMRILVTEMAGRASIELKSRELGLDLAGHPDTLSRVTKRVKDLEAGGWSFEAADASFELLVRGELGEAAARRSRWSRTGCWSSTARTARWSPRRRSRCGYAASG